jgi:hypothetical protein
MAGTTSASGIYWKNADLFATSDERFKNFEGDVKVDFEELLTIPKKYFKWKADGETGDLHIGTSAQKLKEVYPELVSGDDDQYAVAYDKLSVIALAAVDKLHEENLELKKKVEELEERLTRIEWYNRPIG